MGFIKQITILLIFYFFFNLFTNLRVWYHPRFQGESKCKRYDQFGFEGPEDFVKLDDDTLLIADSSKILTMYHRKLGASAMKNGNIYSFRFQENKPLIQKLPINNFPKNISFNPLGIELYQNKFLYVINKAYSRGGERIEVIQVQKKNGTLSLNYIESIEFQGKYSGQFNSLTVLNSNEFLVTQWKCSEEILNENQDVSVLSKIQNMACAVLSLEKTYTFYCKKEKNQGSCQKIESTLGVMNNGIIKDKYNRIFIADSLKYQINVYEMKNHTKPQINPPIELIKINEIQTNGMPDNLIYDEQQDLIYVGTNDRVQDFINLQYALNDTSVRKMPDGLRMHGGILQFKNNKNVNLIQQNQKIILKTNSIVRSISAAIELKGHLIFGSPVDHSIGICKI